MPAGRCTPRVVAVCVAALASCLGTPNASASVVSYSGHCARTVDVVQWAPANGASARFIADTFESHSQTGVWIGLGRTKTAFWSAEGGDPNDACDDCRRLDLVETRFDGSSKRYTIIDDKNYPADRAIEKAEILTALWKLAKKKWPADKLEQTYTIELGAPASDAEGDPPFVVEVLATHAKPLQFDLTANTSMCWCEYEWHTRPIHQP